MGFIIVQVNPVIDYSVRGLCVKPYYNHPKGCPNFNKKKGCPPNAELFDKVYDLTKPASEDRGRFLLSYLIKKDKSYI